MSNLMFSLRKAKKPALQMLAQGLRRIFVDTLWIRGQQEIVDVVVTPCGAERGYWGMGAACGGSASATSAASVGSRPRSGFSELACGQKAERW
jgi:hypothetical protein